MTGTANQIPDKETDKSWYKHWQMWVIILIASFGIYIGGVTSGYFMWRAESLQRTEQRDKKVDEIQKKLETLPEQTAKELKATEQGDPK